ncbi:hypothetical protein GCM10025790_21040 [Nesterenkonia rhizosphaerae]|uniref:Uncharacterized protein n=1 Tax=Nesterenkonia rhizosphaerae TaxID=1348272 RepID=A0ABP9G091_9MICC
MLWFMRLTAAAIQPMDYLQLLILLALVLLPAADQFRHNYKLMRELEGEQR